MYSSFTLNVSIGTLFYLIKSKKQKSIVYLCIMNNDEQFKNLLEKLSEDKNWPQVYMFKFIITAQHRRIALIESKFSDEAIIHEKESSGGKYISITVKEVMLSPEAVIEKYKEVNTIEGVMSL